MIRIHSMVNRGCELRIRQNKDGRFAVRLYDGDNVTLAKTAEGRGASIDVAIMEAFSQWSERESRCDCDRVDAMAEGVVTETRHGPYCSYWMSGAETRDKVDREDRPAAIHVRGLGWCYIADQCVWTTDGRKVGYFEWSTGEAVMRCNERLGGGEAAALLAMAAELIAVHERWANR